MTFDPEIIPAALAFALSIAILLQIAFNTVRWWRRRGHLCVGCMRYRADPPSALCPGCQAYREHQA